MQAQDPRSARLALRARTRGLTAAEVASDDELVTGWLMRGTLHLVHVEDYAWLHSLTATPTRMRQNATRLAQLGIDARAAERAIALMETMLASDGPLPRADIGERLVAADVPAHGQALPHLLWRACLDGLTVIDGHGRHGLARDRLPRQKPLDRDAALRELAQRYLRGHAPATEADLAPWSGLPLRAIRDALAAKSGEKWGQTPIFTARLVPSFDPYLLGWKDRSFIVGDEHVKRVYPGGGVIRATVIDDRAQAVGTWSLTGTIDLFDGSEPGPELRAELADVARFEGKG